MEHEENIKQYHELMCAVIKQSVIDITEYYYSSISKPYIMKVTKIRIQKLVQWFMSEEKRVGSINWLLDSVGIKKEDFFTLVIKPDLEFGGHHITDVKESLKTIIDELNRRWG